MNSVRVIELRLLPWDKPLRAFVDIQVGDWIVRDWRIVKKNRSRATVLPPQVSWKDPETGEIKFKGVLTIPSEEKQMIDAAVLSAYSRELEKNHGNHL
jgi:hypothetical protein